MADKSKSVMAAIKGRKGVAPKKGVALLGIMQKLTAKRKAANGDVKDGKGGWAGDTAKKVVGAASDLFKKDSVKKAVKGVAGAAAIATGSVVPMGIAKGISMIRSNNASTTPSSSATTTKATTTKPLPAPAKAKPQKAAESSSEAHWKRVSNGQLTEEDMKKKPGTVFK